MLGWGLLRLVDRLGELWTLCIWSRLFWKPFGAMVSNFTQSILQLSGDFGEELAEERPVGEGVPVAAGCFPAAVAPRIMPLTASM